MEKGKKRSRGLTTVQRMYLSYVAICLIPMVVLTGALSLFMCRCESAGDSVGTIASAGPDRLPRPCMCILDRARSLGQMLSDARWVKRRGAAPGLYDDQFDLRTKLDLCEDLRGYRGSGAISQIAVVFPRKGEVFSTSGFYQTEDYFHTFSLGKDQQMLEPQQVYDLLPDQGALVNGSDLGMTGMSAHKLFFVEELEYNDPMRCFLMVELDCSAIRNQIEFLTSDQMRSASIVDVDGPLRAVRFGAEEREEVDPCLGMFSGGSAATPADPARAISPARPPIVVPALLVVALAVRIAGKPPSAPIAR